MSEEELFGPEWEQAIRRLQRRFLASKEAKELDLAHKDPWMSNEKLNVAFLEDHMRGFDGQGDLEVAVYTMVEKRFEETGKTSTAYELAWLFRRPRPTLKNALRNLERKGMIFRRVGDKRTYYEPVAGEFNPLTGVFKPARS